MATFAVLVRGRVPTALGLGAAVGVLLLTGVITSEQTRSGLAAAIDRVLSATGERSRLFRLTASSMAMSAVLPNTPLVALVAPRVVTWARRNGTSAATFLMPLSLAAVLGGVVTVIGTSTNLVVSDLLVAASAETLGVFEITPIGLPVAVVGLAMLVLTAPRLLRRPDQLSPSAPTPPSATRPT